MIRIEGARLIDFLQKVIASDARRLRPGGPPLYAAVLSPQGRYLHDMFLHPAWDGEASVAALGWSTRAYPTALACAFLAPRMRSGPPAPTSSPPLRRPLRHPRPAVMRVRRGPGPGAGGAG